MEIFRDAKHEGPKIKGKSTTAIVDPIMSSYFQGTKLLSHKKYIDSSSAVFLF
jgi:hypothetical protein